MIKPCIAIIVSYNEYHCREFIRRYDLNRKHFQIITEIHKLMGIDRKTPIIIVGNIGCYSKQYEELIEFIRGRFYSVRFIDC